MVGICILILPFPQCTAAWEGVLVHPDTAVQGVTSTQHAGHTEVLF